MYMKMNEVFAPQCNMLVKESLGEPYPDPSSLPLKLLLLLVLFKKLIWF